MFKKLFTLILTIAALASVQAKEIDLSVYERSLYSAHGEDGVLSKLFQLIKPDPKFCVEIGAGDGMTRNNTCLLRKQGWNCILFDRMFQFPEFNLVREFVTAENVNDLFESYSVPRDLDLLVINIEYNDFYVWLALKEKFRPSVVLIEYNGTHLPDEDKVVKYHPYFTGGGHNNYFGASILALYNLGRSKGYSLVYAEKSGSNLFFVRDDIISEKQLNFKDMNNADKIYREPTYGTGPNGGAPQDPKNRPYLSSSAFIK